MKKLVTYVVMLAYLTVTLRPVQAQPQLYGIGQTDMPMLAQLYESDSEDGDQPADSDMEAPPPQPQQPAPAVSGKPKIAVYVSEYTGYSDAEKSALKNGATSTLVRSGRFQVVERSDVIDEELQKQASGTVDDDQLTRFGRQAGAQFICVVDMTHLRDRSVPRYERQCSGQGESYRCYDVHVRTDHYKDHQVSVRLIDVETAEVLAFGLIEQSIMSGTEITGAANSAVNKMLANVQNAKATDVPKMAVYVTSEGKGMGRRGHSVGNATNALYSYTLEALFQRSRKLGGFKVIERSEAFTRQIDREQTTQRSGHVDDGQIARLGKQYGIQRILVVSMDHAMGNYVISGRIVNIETATIEKMSEQFSDNNEMTQIARFSNVIVEEMFGLSQTEERERAEQKRIAEERRQAQAVIDAKRARSTKIWGGILLVGLIGLVVWGAVTPDKSNEKVSVK